MNNMVKLTKIIKYSHFCWTADYVQNRQDYIQNRKDYLHLGRIIPIWAGLLHSGQVYPNLGRIIPWVGRIIMLWGGFLTWYFTSLIVYSCFTYISWVTWACLWAVSRPFTWLSSSWFGQDCPDLGRIFPTWEGSHRIGQDYPFCWNTFKYFDFQILSFDQIFSLFVNQLDTEKNCKVIFKYGL